MAGCGARSGLCYNRPVHAARDHHDPAGERPFPGAARSASPVCCRRCGSDVSELAAEAVYCPRCGLRLPPPGAVVDHSGSSARGESPLSSVVVRGYANAMFRLGARYEARHNESESVRCYGKASHLGNAAAKVCLLDIAMSKTLGPPRDTPPPS